MLALGVLALAGVFIIARDPDHHGIRTLDIAVLALAVTLSLGGLQTIRWGVSAAKGRVREEEINEDLFSIENAQGLMIEELRKFLAEERTQSGRSKEARDRLERMERVMLVLAASMEGAAEFGDRMVAIEQGLNALVRAVRETADRQSREASAAEVRMDSFAKQLDEILRRLPSKEQIVAEVREQVVEQVRAEMADALMHARAIGFVDALDGQPPADPRTAKNVRRLPGPDQR
ncbi:hypothetical protein [Catellatospora sp. NPDC049609]|uniref:hypothetical protein n=1 Tax=Catellatospora sp. NPDC049609 TaxID=3155505 RepID=UPI003430F982